MLRPLLKLNPLRIGLVLVTLFLVVVRRPENHLGLITSALAPLWFFVICLDLCFAALYCLGGEAQQRAHLRSVIALELLLLVLLALSWMPILFSFGA